MSELLLSVEAEYPTQDARSTWQEVCSCGLPIDIDFIQLDWTSGRQDVQQELTEPSRYSSPDQVREFGTCSYRVS